MDQELIITETSKVRVGCSKRLLSIKTSEDDLLTVCLDIYSMSDRPIKFNPSGKYNLNFIDYQN